MRVRGAEAVVAWQEGTCSKPVMPHSMAIFEFFRFQNSCGQSGGGGVGGRGSVRACASASASASANSSRRRRPTTDTRVLAWKKVDHSDTKRPKGGMAHVSGSFSCEIMTADATTPAMEAEASQVVKWPSQAKYSAICYGGGDGYGADATAYSAAVYGCYGGGGGVGGLRVAVAVFGFGFGCGLRLRLAFCGLRKTRFAVAVSGCSCGCGCVPTCSPK